MATNMKYLHMYALIGILIGGIILIPIVGIYISISSIIVILSMLITLELKLSYLKKLKQLKKKLQ